MKKPPSISIIKEIKQIIRKARYAAFSAVNTEMLKAYFGIGRSIVEEEQRGEKRAGYGTKLLEEMSYELVREFGRGFSATALKNMRKFYCIYKDRISQSMTDEFYQLTWTHYCELIKIADKSKRSYFEKYAVVEQLSVRDLKRQIYSLHYERLLASRDKKALIAQEKKTSLPVKPNSIIKDPYVLEFLGIGEKEAYSEKEIEARILNHLQKFLLELGQGFSFVARQKRFTIDNDQFYIDLLFYNIYLKCYVVVELKSAKFKHEYAGQMNFYLNYVQKEMNKKGDNVPIGIILCTEKNRVQVEFALSGMQNNLFVSKYHLYLPNKKELERKLKEAIENEKEE